MSENVASLFERRWHCYVVSSGFSVASGCSRKDPHDPEGWRCGYRWEAPVLTDEEAVHYGVSEQLATDPDPKKCPNGNSWPECTVLDPCEACWGDQLARDQH